MIWLRVEGHVRRVVELQEIVVRELGGLGLRLDRRPFSPHVTIARVSRRAGNEERRRVAQVAAELDGYDTGSFPGERNRSDGQRPPADRAVYTPIAEITL